MARKKTSKNWLVSKSFTVSTDDIKDLDRLKLHEEESHSSVVRRLIREAAKGREVSVPGQLQTVVA